MKRAACLVLVGAVLGSLGGACSRPPAAPQAEIVAPYPYTVEEIRAGCNFGRAIEYDVRDANGQIQMERWVFRPIDPLTVEITTQSFDEKGGPVGTPAVETDKYAELHEHARFPQNATVIDEATVRLAAGTYDCMHYVVTQGDTVKEFWFAKTLPGPPVKMTITKGGVLTYSMAMRGNRTHTKPQ
jgi:hypothetical protein